MPGALEGLKVVDLSRVLGGPYCAQMLADHGAEVIKIEPPQGDETRLWGPPFDKEGISAYYAGINRNKRTVSLEQFQQDLAAFRFGEIERHRALVAVDAGVVGRDALLVERWAP